MSITNRQGKSPLTNRLWLARKRRGLSQKQVAYLLNQRGIDQISRYEQGARLPSLEHALRLEIIYGMPVRLLFKERFDELELEVRQRISDRAPLRSLYGALATNKESLADYCAFADLLTMPNAPAADLGRVRDHVTDLAKSLAFGR
jgi:transcriptional regulator with XRE-family HTH domain